MKISTKPGDCYLRGRAHAPSIQSESLRAASDNIAVEADTSATNKIPERKHWYWKIDASLQYIEITTSPDASSQGTLAADKSYAHSTSIPSASPDSYPIACPDFDLTSLQRHIEQLENYQPFNNFIFCHAFDGKLHWSCASGIPIFKYSDCYDEPEFCGYEGIGQDITDFKDTLAQYSLMAQLSESYDMGTVVFTREDELLICNSSICRMLGLSYKSTLPGTSLGSMIDVIGPDGEIPLRACLGPEWKDKVRHFLSKTDSTGEWKTASGLTLRLRSKRTVDGSLIITVWDITEHAKLVEELQQERNLLRSLINAIPDSIYALDANLHYLVANNAALALHGYPENHDIKGTPEPVSVTTSSTNGTGLTERYILETGNSILNSIVSQRDPLTGENRTVTLNKVPLIDTEDNVVGIVGFSRDQTDILKLTEQLSFQAEHDELTGLINRRGFDLRVERAIQDYTSQNLPAVVCFADLDQFKIVNDTVGHKAGDELLKQISLQISRQLRKSDVLARLGGDEFGMLFRNCSIDEITPRLDKIIEQISNMRFHWDEKLFEIGISLGAVGLSSESPTLDSVCSQADMACYTAKDLGRGRYHIFSSDDEKSSQRQNELERAADIRSALEENRFTVYLQPITPSSPHLDGHKHFEALVRMQDTNGEIVSPGVFIPAAERFELMGAVDRWVISYVLSHYVTAFPDGPGTIVSINLSGNSLNDPRLVDFVRDEIRRNAIDPTKLCFEITETAFISNLSIAQGFINELSDIGCDFALDDFGSGLSSFAYLKNFKINYLKIDGSFVRNMVDDSTDRAMVRAIHSVGQTLGLETIAEFVETEQHVELLRQIGVDYLQGYAIGRPEPMVNPEQPTLTDQSTVSNL